MAAVKRIAGRDLTGRLAIVTGADGGIGSAFCRRLAAAGADLLLVGNRQRELEETALAMRQAGANTTTLVLDLTAPDAPQALMDHIQAQGLKPFLLINNAGVFAFSPLLEMESRRIRLFIDLHMRAVTDLSRLMADKMLHYGEGHILNMSSMSCWTPMPGLSMYAATKAYIRVMSRVLHYELRDSGVKVTVACPGGIATDLFGLPPKLMKLAVGLRAVQRPDDFANAALKATLRGKMQYVNGLLNRIGIVAVGAAPTPLRMLVKRKMLDKGIRR